MSLQAKMVAMILSWLAVIKHLILLSVALIIAIQLAVIVMYSLEKLPPDVQQILQSIWHLFMSIFGG